LNVINTPELMNSQITSGSSKHEHNPFSIGE